MNKARYDHLGSGWDGQFANQGYQDGENVRYHLSNADPGQFSDFFQNLFGGEGWNFTEESTFPSSGVRRRRGRDHETAIIASYLISCQSCGTVNRITADKEGLRGRCGCCKAALPPLYCHPQQLNNRTFDAFISSYPGPVLAEFWSPA